MKVCKLPNCDKKYYGGGYCRNHYRSFCKYGEIRHTVSQLNRFILLSKVALVELYNRTGEFQALAFIDKEDYEKCKKYRWGLNGYGYVKNHDVGFLHHFVGGRNKNLDTDHINRNKLDNRKCNLRIVTRSKNVLNKEIPKSNVSGVIGVSWRECRKKWTAYIDINRKRKILGLFKLFEDAVTARKLAEIEREKKG